MKKYNFLKPILLGFLVFSSCNEDILEKKNPNELSTETFLKNEVQLQAAVNGVYAALQTNNLYGREYFFLHDMLADENTGSGGLEAPRAAALNYNLDPGNKLVNDVWQGLYRLIHRANLVTSGIDNVPEAEVSAEKRNRYEAEARFLRAWAYFDLVSLWGPVPLITEPATIETTTKGVPRSPEAEVYAQIFEDLNFAEEHLLMKSAYPEADLGRVTKGAAQAMKGRVHLFRGEYAQAKAELAKVIASGEYQLVDRYLDNFEEENENNEESIFEVQFSTAHGYGNPWSPDGNGIDEVTFRGQEYTPTTGWRNVNPSPRLKAAFGEDDPRFGYNFYLDGDTYNNGANIMQLAEPGWQKYSNAYKQPSENQISGINFRVIRYADVLLMMAEAVNWVDGPAAAIDYLNMVRARADVDLDPLPAPATKEAFFKLLEQERMRELPGEQVRNRDIRRWRRLGLLDYEPISNYKETYALLPIPSVEISNNPALSPADQNPGY